MKYYCIMVRSGGEELFKSEVLKNIEPDADDIHFWFLKRKVKNGGRQKGVIIEQPLFPGYVFMGAEDVDANLYNRISSTVNFYHFLKNNSNITPLVGRDLDYLHTLLNNGETAGISQAMFDEKDRIVILGGPLQGFTGNILRVNKRKQRVTVKIDLCGSINSFDLCYDLVEKAPEDRQSLE
jgi:transcriptional antiterminator NusG